MQRKSEKKPAATKSRRASKTVSNGLRITPRFVRDGRHPFDGINWDRRTSIIKDKDDSILFEMNDVEVPAFWSQLATDIVASKYFRKSGVPTPAGHEQSVKQVVARLAETIASEGRLAGYFATKNDSEVFCYELMYILLYQLGAFNSPVWFNVGLWHKYGITGSGGNWAWDRSAASSGVFETTDAYSRPQASACFLQSVNDDLMSIYTLIKDEARLFKYGSGTGTNFSAVRGKMEKLSGGGTSSGLMSFLEVFDRAAGSLKSGGTTRRAAKLVCLDMDHPEIREFIHWKSLEEKKVRALIAAGYSADFNGDAYHTISGQNSNNSVRVTDTFMEAALSEAGSTWTTRERTTGKVVSTYNAKDLWKEIATCAWECADPGVMYHTTINAWHTCPNSGAINTANPCQPGFATVLTPEGIRTFDDIDVGSIVWSGKQWTRVTHKVATGVKEVFRFETRAGTFIGTDNHRLISHGTRVEARDAEDVDLCLGPAPTADVLCLQDVVDGWVLGDGSVHKASDDLVYLQLGQDDAVFHEAHAGFVVRERPGLAKGAWEVRTTISSHELPYTYERRIPKRFRNGSSATARSFLRGLYAANGSVCGERVTLKAASKAVIDDAQQMLSSLGIASYVTINQEHDVTFSNGTYTCKQSYDLNIGHVEGRRRFAELIGFVHAHKTARLHATLEESKTVRAPKDNYDIRLKESLGEMPVYDITVDAEEHTYWTGGLLVSNCIEFMFLDDTACNLASINLTKFMTGKNGDWFDVEAFQHTARILFIAQEILVDVASYPTKKIAENSHRFRPLGLGYANLGALLMRCGVAYDSEAGRDTAKALTSLMTATAYETSAELAKHVGAFEGFEINREPMLRVMHEHRERGKVGKESGRAQHPIRHLDIAADVTWTRAIEVGERHGYRNAQATLLAPCGTIGLLMDCDTTGVEPSYALMAYKKLAGGGGMDIINQSVPSGLAALGYGAQQREEILAYLSDKRGLEGAPHLNPEHLPVFDCAAPSTMGGTCIPWMGHLAMMAAVQPCLSGAISKTVNMPESSTVEDVQRTYELGWSLGLKAVALYRDRCKASQPMNVKGKEEATVPQAAAIESIAGRNKLPSKRRGFTQEARVGGHKIFLRTGEYEDGSLGEIFVDMHKEGAAFRSLMNCFSMSVSLGLQHGVPLETFVEQFTFTRFEPQGAVEGHPNIKLSTSIVDYLFRVLGVEYLQRYDLAHIKPDGIGAIKPIESAAEAQTDAPPCDQCGHLTVRNGACYRCLSCGNSMGCS